MGSDSEQRKSRLVIKKKTLIDNYDPENLKQGLQQFIYICFYYPSYGKKDLGKRC